EGKKKGNKPDDQGKTSNQADSASKSTSDEQQEKEDQKSQQQQDKQKEQLLSVQSNKPTEVDHQDPGNSIQLSSQQSTVQNQQAAKMEPLKQTGKGKQKDWACIKCNKMNFAKKNICKDCNEPRPAPPEPPKEIPQEPQTSNQIVPSFSSLDISKSEIETSSEAKKLYEGTRGRKCRVEVNYVELNLKNLSKVCYHYDVAFVPDTPKKMLSAAMDEFMRKYFKGYFYAFDGRKILITNKKLSMKDLKNDEYTEKVEAYFGGRKRTFDVKVQLVSTDNMEVLKSYKNDEKPAKANQNLDIILKSVFRQQIDNGKAVKANRNLFFAREANERIDLGEGMELWYGLFQAAILGRAKVYLNIDVLHKAFPTSIHLLDYIKVSDRNRLEYLDDEKKKNLNNFLTMLTIGYRLNQNDPPRTYGFNGIGEPASKAKFKFNGKDMTVKDYFEKEKKIKLQFPNLPVLQVGSKTNSILLPLEFCELPPGQVNNKTCSKYVIQKLTRESVTSPAIRKEKIRKRLNETPYNTDPTIKAFGIEVGKTFQTVEARVIDPPNLNYKDGIVRPSRGVWNAGTFLEVKGNQIKWCILNGGSVDNTTILHGLKRDLFQEAIRQNIFLDDININDIINIKFAENKAKVEQKFKELKDLGYQLVVVVLSNDKEYQVVKNTSELCVGILTTCIKEETVRKRLGGNNATVKNILIKLNAKLNGKSHEIVEPSFKAISANAGVMFVGADVTHPSPEQRSIPSVVGVVSSYDQVGTKYTPTWRLQEPTVEMIQDLENILVEHLKAYFNFNKKLPKRIMYYRDGVSDSQFNKVLDVEMTAIKKAMHRSYGQKPQAEVTFVVVQKRHHTRFFPTDAKFADKNGNILAGTVVDKDIVHPFQYQFFMASHTSILGVTKPSKYCILANESKIIADDIQAITFDLCHLFSRCNRSVSYPAPTYYAHLVAARGKNYFDGNDITSIMENIDRANQKYQNNGINQTFVRDTPMFFV
ncbi:unnamed protein product, partial [Chironomus riparius]